MATRLKRRRRWFFRILKVGLAIAAAAYLLVCLGLWRYQTRMMFFPDAAIRQTPAAVGLPYEDVWLPSGEGTVHAWWIDSRSSLDVEIPVVLFFHGNGSNLGDMAGRARLLNDLGYRSFFIDYRGYGRSSGPFPSEQRVYEDAEAAWQYASERTAADRIIIYGQSIGGAIAIDLAVNHPDAAGLIVESSFTSMQAMVAYAKSLPFVPVNWLLTQRFESLEKVKSLRVPALFIHGSADRVVPAEMSQALYRAAPQNKSYLLINGAGHSGLPAVNSNLYNRTVSAFIEQYAR